MIGPFNLGAAFGYDADGQRSWSDMNGVVTVYIGNYYEWNTTTGSGTSYYYAGSMRVAIRQGSTVSWLLADHLGSANTTMDSTGTITGELRYLPWGETRFSSGTTPTDRRYTGQIEEPELGLYFYNARWYDPALGRFTQPDSIIPQPGSPLAWDRYAYTLNNPVNWIDPSGHKACDDDGNNCFNSFGNPIGNNTAYLAELSEEDIKILTTLITMESCSGKIPGNVNYMKAWSLLNARSYHQARNRNFTPFEDWKNHERALLNNMGISGSLEEQTTDILALYEKYANDKHFNVSAGTLFDIQEQVTKAANKWIEFGSNSSYDPVNGATGFTDAAGLHYPNGVTQDSFLKDLPQHEAIITNKAEMEKFRALYSLTGVTSGVYPYSIQPETNFLKYTFTWFKH